MQINRQLKLISYVVIHIQLWIVINYVTHWIGDMSNVRGHDWNDLYLEKMNY